MSGRPGFAGQPEAAWECILHRYRRADRSTWDNALGGAVPAEYEGGQMQSHDPLLTVRGVTLQYKTPNRLITATYKVSFDVFQGDRFILLGPSGCGKSTL